MPRSPGPQRLCDLGGTVTLGKRAMAESYQVGRSAVSRRLRRLAGSLASVERATTGRNVMSLPLPAGPDYPVYMPQDRIMDRTKATTNQIPRLRRAPTFKEKRGSSGRAAEAGSSRSSMSK